MERIKCADRMRNVHSDIRGPLFEEAMEMQSRGIEILKLNTENPATFGFGLPKSIGDALAGQVDKGVGYCDFRGMPQAREAICAYEKGARDVPAVADCVMRGLDEAVCCAGFAGFAPSLSCQTDSC